MKVTANKSDLARALAPVQKILDKKSPNPILAYVMLEAKDDYIELSATDLVTSFRARIDALVTISGNVAILGSKLLEIVKESSDSAITLELTADTSTAISFGKSSYAINSASANEYPDARGLDFDGAFSFAGETFSQMLDKVLYSVSNDETRPNICGVYCELVTVDGKNKLRAVSTDGSRISVIQREVTSISASIENASIIIPRKGAICLKDITAEDTSDGLMKIDMDYISIKNKHMSLGVRLVDGKFPPYEKVMPKNFISEIRLPLATLLASLKRVNVINSPDLPHGRLDIRAGLVSISASSNLYGSSSEEIMCDTSGESLSVNFNIKHLIESASHMTCNDTVIVKFSSVDSPYIVTTETDTDYYVALMPMRNV